MTDNEADVVQAVPTSSSNDNINADNFNENIYVERSKFGISHDIDVLGDEDDIELGSGEQELFLNEGFVKTRGILMQLSNSSASHSSSDHYLKQSSKSRCHMIDEYQMTEVITDVNLHEKSAFEYDQIPKQASYQDGNSHSAMLTPSKVYHAPNYQQFAGALSPSSPTSVLVSFIIVFVILCVTILPIVLPSDQESGEFLRHTPKLVNSLNGTVTGFTPREHSNVRCKCVCPPISLHTALTTNETKSETSKTIQTNHERRLYLGNTPPNQCNCINIVALHLTDPRIPMKQICSNCQCKYQNRNTTAIRRNVLFFIVVLMGLSSFMIAQELLKYFRVTRRSIPRHLRWLAYRPTEYD